jgi:hypothetical protein
MMVVVFGEDSVNDVNCHPQIRLHDTNLPNCTTWTKPSAISLIHMFHWGIKAPEVKRSRTTIAVDQGTLRTA